MRGSRKLLFLQLFYILVIYSLDIFENGLIQPTISLSLHLRKQEGAGPNAVLKGKVQLISWRISPAGLNVPRSFEKT